MSLASPLSFPRQGQRAGSALRVGLWLSWHPGHSRVVFQRAPAVTENMQGVGLILWAYTFAMYLWQW